MTIFEASVVRAFAQREAGRSTAVVACIVSSAVLGCGAKTGLEVDPRRTSQREQEIAPEVSRPRHIWPLSTAVVSTHRPTLEWQHQIGGSSTRIELSRFRDFRTVDRQEETATPRWRPREALTPGPWFWRLVAVQSGAISPVWTFTVPRRDSNNDSIVGWTQDFNADGIADVVVTSQGDLPSRDFRYIEHRGRAGEPLGEGRVVDVADPRTLVISLTPDVYGSGFPGFIGLPNVQQQTTNQHLVVGSELGLRDTGIRFSLGVLGVGDVNNDGYGDAVQGDGTPDTGGFLGQTSLVFGRWTGLDQPRRIPLRSPTSVPPESRVMEFTAPIDIDGDRKMDRLLLANTGVPPYSLIVQLRPLSTDSREILLPLARRTRGARALLGDVNGDGFPDLGLSGTDRTAVIVYGGAQPRMQSFRMASEFGFDHPVDITSYVLRSAGDLNGDGYSDCVEMPFELNVVASWLRDGVPVHMGSAEGLRSDRAITLRPPPGATFFGHYVAGCGDVDADGFDDLLVGGALGQAGVVFVYRGSPSGISSQPSYSIQPPSPVWQIYGWRIGAG